MTNTPEKSEIIGQNPDAVELFNTLESLDSDQKKFNYLRDVFLEDADVDEYLQFLEEDEELDLTRRQILRLKTVLAGYKFYLNDYIERTGKRIGMFDERLKESGEKFMNLESTPEEISKIFRVRKRVAQAMQIAKVPRGAKGKSLMEISMDAKELSPKEIDKYLEGLKGRFDELKKELKHDVEWADVEKTLRDNPEAVKKLMKLDEAGFEMNVFRSKNKGEIVFRTAQRNVLQIAEKYSNIMYDKQTEIDYPEDNVNGNAVDLARDFGVELADKELYEQLRLGWGCMWLESDDATRKKGLALRGTNDGVYQCGAHSAAVLLGSFCPALRVKKS